MTYDLIVANDGHSVYKPDIPDLPSYFGPNGYLSIKLAYVPEIGQFLLYEDKDYAILTVTTYQEKEGNVVTMVHVMTCLEIDDEGENLGNLPITLRSDMSGVTVR